MHLPWRHARDIVNCLSLNFFDAVLNGNVEALARLGPAAVGGSEDLTVQRKQGGPVPRVARGRAVEYHPALPG